MLVSVPCLNGGVVIMYKISLYFPFLFYIFFRFSYIIVLVNYVLIFYFG